MKNGRKKEVEKGMENLSGEKALLISEKPDLMRKMESAYQKHKSEIPYEVDFQSQSGHLVELLTPDEMDPVMKKRGTWENLPFHPEEHGGWKYKLIDQKFPREMFGKIKKALQSGQYDFIINDGDPDQEGELLIHNVLDYLGNTLPVKRVWTNDVTEGALVEAMKNLMDDDHDPMLVNLLSAAHAREHSDYRVGMNISRAADLLMHRHDTSCGRVMTPMLYLIVKREHEIRNFTPVTTYGVSIRYQEGFEGRLTGEEELKREQEVRKSAKSVRDKDTADSYTVWFDTREEAESLIQELSRKSMTASVVSFQQEEVKTYAPKLFKLSSIQAEADRRFGIPASQTLRVIQRLYEGEYVSYPRTGCEYLSSRENFSGILKAVGRVPGFEGFVQTVQQDKGAVSRVRHTKKWVNDAALQQAGHSALRPTVKAPNLSRLTADERTIYQMIAERFVAMFYPPLVQNRTELVSSWNGKLFRSTGKTLVSPGYTVVFGSTMTETEIPVHQEKDELKIEEAKIEEKTTKCPSRYTTGTLISACENPLKYLDDQRLKKLGRTLHIGTDATRAGILDKLIRKGYVKGGKYLEPTEMGEKLIGELDGLMITRVDMTGIWQEGLDQIRNGTLTREAFEQQMIRDTGSMIDEIRRRAEEEEAAIEKVAFEREGVPVSFRRVWGSHRFTDEEVETLKQGGEITFDGVSKTGEPYQFTGMLSGKKALKFKVTAMKKTGADYVSGVWRKKTVEIPREFRGYTFSDEECDRLFHGEEILISGLKGERKFGKKVSTYNYQLNIRLTTKNGLVTFATSPAKDPEKEYASGTLNGKTVEFCRIWGGHRFTDEEVQTLLDGKELSLRNLTSKKGNPYGVIGKLTQPKNGVCRFIKVKWIREKSGKKTAAKTAVKTAAKSEGK